MNHAQPSTLADEPHTLALWASVAEIVAYRPLLVHLVARDLKVRYKRSLFGVMWAFAEPLFQMVLFALVFSLLLGIHTPKYPVFILSGVLVWSFIHTGVTYALPSVTGNASLVKKIYFPLEILTLATVAGRFVHFLLSLVLLVPFLIYYDVACGWAWLWLPLLVLLMASLVAGLALLFASLNTLYEDMSFLVNFGFMSLFYLSPVFYSPDMVPSHLRGLYLLNPVAGLITCFRDALLANQAPTLEVLGPAALVAVTALWVGARTFGKLKWQFAEVL